MMRRFTVVFVLLGVIAVSGVVRGDRFPDPFNPKKWVGAWDLMYTANYSTCKNTAVGDQRPAQLGIRIEKGQFRAKEVSSTGSNDLSGKTVAAEWPMLSFYFKAKRGGEIGLELRRQDDGSITGRRIVANPESCAIIYDVSGKRR